MKTLDLYKWIAGTKSDFIRPFQREDLDENPLLEQAKTFWNQLENSGLVIIAIFVVIGILAAVIYYGPYNNKPGRHYRPTHWLVFLLITFLATFLFTWGIEAIMVDPKLNGAAILEMKIAIGNAVYATALFFVTSVIWCMALPTNAYRLFKF